MTICRLTRTALLNLANRLMRCRFGKTLISPFSKDAPHLSPSPSALGGGAYGTHFWVDPVNKLTAILLKNSLMYGGAGSETCRGFEHDVMNSLR